MYIFLYSFYFEVSIQKQDLEVLLFWTTSDWKFKTQKISKNAHDSFFLNQNYRHFKFENWNE